MTVSQMAGLAGLPMPAKVMVTAFLALIGVGYLVAVFNVYEHHQEADLRPGLTLDDLRRVYHGLDAPVTRQRSSSLPSRMLKEVLPGGRMRKHLESGGEAAVESLISWLQSGAGEADFTRPIPSVPGGLSPQSVVTAQCVRCHNPMGDAAEHPYATDADSRADYALVARLALPLPGPTTQETRVVHLAPAGRAALIQITHAHILAMPVFALAVGALFLLTGLRPGIKAMVAPAPMIALCVDFGSWWLARISETFVYVIGAAGAVFGITLAVQITAVLGSMWLGPVARAGSGGHTACTIARKQTDG